MGGPPPPPPPPPSGGFRSNFGLQISVMSNCSFLTRIDTELDCPRRESKYFCSLYTNYVMPSVSEHDLFYSSNSAMVHPNWTMAILR